MAKYENDVVKLLELVGGKENINTVAHCATRMRFVLKDDAKADAEAIDKMDVVKGTFTNAGQFQVIVGNDVPTFYREFAAYAGITEATKAEVKEAGAKKQNKAQQAVAFLADIFVPLIPALVAGGLLLGLGNILGATDLPWLPKGETYLTLAQTKDGAATLKFFTDWIGGAVFGFLPVGVTWSTVRRLGGTPILGIVMGLLLVSSMFMNAYDYGNVSTYKDGTNLAVIAGPEIVTSTTKAVETKNKDLKGTALLDAKNDAITKVYEAAKKEVDAGKLKPKFQLDLFGLKINLIGYQALVLPALFAGLLLVWIERLMNKITPDVVKLVVVPFVTLVVTGILAITIVGPAARLLGDLLAGGFKYLLATPGLNVFGALLFGGSYAPLVITGLHHTFIAVDLQLTASFGGTPIWPMIAMSNISQSMAALAVFFIARRQKEAKLADVSISGAVAAWFGITEPAMFGANLKLSYPFIAAITASAAGAVILTLGGVLSNGIGVGGLALAWASIKFDGSNQLWWWIATLVTCVVAFGGTLLLSKSGLKLPSKKNK